MKTRPDSLRRIGVALLLALAGGSAFALELPELMQLLGQNKSGEASFTEQRFVKGLDAPLTASGQLSFAAPDRFTRDTQKPRAESMTVEGNQLVLTRSGRSRSLPLDATPEMLALVEAVRGTLTGNAQTLTRYFRPSLAGDRQAWTLELQPLASGKPSAVRAVRIAGQLGELRRIDMDLADGDRSVMTIGPLRPLGSVIPSGPAPAASAP